MSQTLCAVSISLFLSLTASQSLGHEFDSERVVIIDSSKDNLEVLITFREAPGKRLDYLLGIYDKNNDGIFSKRESLAVSPALKKMALSGLSASTILKNEKTRIKYRRKEGLSIALLFKLPNYIKAIEFEFDQTPQHISTAVHFVGNAMSLTNSIGPTQGLVIMDRGNFGVVKID